MGRPLLCKPPREVHGSGCMLPSKYADNSPYPQIKLQKRLELWVLGPGLSAHENGDRIQRWFASCLARRSMVFKAPQHHLGAVALGLGFAFGSVYLQFSS